MLENCSEAFFCRRLTFEQLTGAAYNFIFMTSTPRGLCSNKSCLGFPRLIFGPSLYLLYAVILGGSFG